MFEETTTNKPTHITTTYEKDICKSQFLKEIKKIYLKLISIASQSCNNYGRIIKKNTKSLFIPSWEDSDILFTMREIYETIIPFRSEFYNGPQYYKIYTLHPITHLICNKHKQFGINLEKYRVKSDIYGDYYIIDEDLTLKLVCELFNSKWNNRWQNQINKKK